ncbi:DUF4105 domain-containing protein [Nitrincola sp. MINF-07-Sa-05]|uniref:lipoprotein N-acyltransferase Lnb domain-containing protein n=1 Tax=Nitrincola salilacus TaxID=3400273 RepID=UPI0039185ACD
MLRRSIILPLILLPLMLLGLWLLIQQPQHGGEWHPLQTRLPAVEQQGNDHHISNIRNFRYREDGTPASADYFDRSYNTEHLQRVWFGLSHFADHGFAHAFLSFEFANDDSEQGVDYLVASVEARLRPDQTYSPFVGLLRQYNRMIVLGTEEDIIGLRSHVRNERVFLYEMTLTQEQQQHLFRGMMSDVASLTETPAFYNTLLHNCVTSLLRHDPDYRVWRHLFDYRVLLPGYGDGFAQDKGWLPQDIELDQLRSENRVVQQHDPLDDDFSVLIRTRDYLDLTLENLVAQQSAYQQRLVRTQGILRHHPDPLHYWIEDERLHRVELFPAEMAAPLLGQTVEVEGRFRFDPAVGRAVHLDSIELQSDQL